MGGFIKTYSFFWKIMVVAFTVRWSMVDGNSILAMLLTTATLFYMVFRGLNELHSWLNRNKKDKK